MPRVVVNRAVTNSNQVGNVILFCSMAWVNELDFSAIPTTEVIKEVNNIYIPGEENLPGIYTNLLSATTINDEEIILSFADKLYSSSTDIDPEIGRAAKKILWDLI